MERIVELNVFIDRHKHPGNRPLGWMCILLGIIGEAIFFVVTPHLHDTHYLLYWTIIILSILGMGIGIFAGPYLLTQTKLKNHKKEN